MNTEPTIESLRAAIDAAHISRDVLQAKVDTAEAERALALADSLAAGLAQPKRSPQFVHLHTSLDDCETGIIALEKRLAGLEKKQFADRQAALHVEITAIADECRNRAALGLALVRLGSAMAYHACDGNGAKEAATYAVDLGASVSSAEVFGSDHRLRIIRAFAEARQLGRDVSPTDVRPLASVSIASSATLVPRLMDALGPIMAEYNVSPQKPTAQEVDGAA